MKVTIIPSEFKIQVDGKPIILNKEDWNFGDQHIHAIQWYGDRGHIEFVTNDPNEVIEDIEIIQKYLDVFFEEIPRIEQIRIQNEESRRNDEQFYAEERAKHEKEKEELKRKIKETAEENARLRAKRSEDSIKRTQELIEKENEERKLKIEAELLALENERIKSEQEIAMREKSFREHFEKEHGEFLKASKKTSESTEKANQIFSDYLKTLEEKKAALESDVKQSYELIDIKEKKVTEELKLREEQNRKLLEKQNELVLKIQEEKELADQKLKLEALEIEQRKQELLKQYENSEKDINLAIQSQEEQLEKIKSQKELFFEEKKLAEEELAVKRRELQLANEELNLRESNIREKEVNFEREKREYVQAAEVELYEKRKRIATETLLSETEKHEIEQQAKMKANEKVKSIANETDPLEVFRLIGTSPDFDISTFPVEKIIAWFSLLKKTKDLCSQYQISYQEVMNNQELKQMLEFEKYDMHDPSNTVHEDTSRNNILLP
jgi:hypothetical protein